MKKIGKLVAGIGSYTDREGNEKTRWLNIGSLLERDDGRQVIKLDCIPVGVDFNGWVNIFEPEDEDRSSGNRGGNPSRDEDIPF